MTAADQRAGATDATPERALTGRYFAVLAWRGDDERATIERVRVRPSVMAFAIAMEAKLRAHDADRGEAGWLDAGCGDVELLDHLECEVEELAAWIFAKPVVDDGVEREAPDVGNMAMMLWHRAMVRLGRA